MPAKASPSRACSERWGCAASAGPHDASPSERGPGGPRHRRQRPRDLQPTSSDVNPRTRHLSRRSGPRSTRPRIPGKFCRQVPGCQRPPSHAVTYRSPRCRNGREVRLRAPVPCVPVVGSASAKRQDRASRQSRALVWDPQPSTRPSKGPRLGGGPPTCPRRVAASRRSPLPCDSDARRCHQARSVRGPARSLATRTSPPRWHRPASMRRRCLPWPDSIGD